MRESGEEGGMIKWLGEKGGELVGTKKRIFVYKLDSFVGFIGDEQVHAHLFILCIPGW
jgi:hypothetical protein